ncbi:hypothetical protein [Roseobacter litoralis]|uniref:hypothetical protein n=1 Tax=Roseobacter litoralis TaxID=42443 RepID=UPI0024959E53|nr:hypothetical protein [Roseobacter litoralis]
MSILGRTVSKITEFYSGSEIDVQVVLIGAIVGLPALIAASAWKVFQHRYNAQKFRLEQEFEKSKVSEETQNASFRDEVQTAIELVKAETNRAIAVAFRTITLRIEERLFEATALLDKVVMQLDELSNKIAIEKGKPAPRRAWVNERKKDLESLQRDAEEVRNAIEILENNKKDALKILDDMQSGRWETLILDAQLVRIEKRLERLPSLEWQQRRTEELKRQRLELGRQHQKMLERLKGDEAEEENALAKRMKRSIDDDSAS